VNTNFMASTHLDSGFRITLLIGLCMVSGTASRADDTTLNWPVRTGPTLNWQPHPNDAAGLPTEWSEMSGVTWKLDLEGLGHSSPIIGGGRIFLTSATKDGTQQFLYCIEQQSGMVLYKSLIFENAEPEPLGNEINTYASPSCALEPDAVYVHFGSYGTARVEPATAKVVWQRRDISCRHFRGPGSSPILWKNLLILTFDGIDAQFLMALDKHTGETVWRTDRTTDYGDLDQNGKPHRDGDMRKAYSTPGLIEVAGRMQVVSVGSRAAFAYDAETGRELWTIRHDDFNASSPPAFFGNHAILNTGTRNSNLLSVTLDATTLGDVTESHVIWNRDKGNSDLSAPILIGNRIYSILNNGVVTCVNAETGEDVWRDRVEGTFTASPVAANGFVYFCNEEGDCFVIRAADQFERIAKNHLDEGLRATPSIANGHLYLRTFGRLYSIGQR